MSNAIINNTDIPHDELVFLYEQKCEELKLETDKNVLLNAEVKKLNEKAFYKNNYLSYLITEINKAIE